ncbi:MAG: NifB/NifX family molybdenum-iron cluster-binding protein [Prolixibacteraceae bacterium]|nr:NifB/NifX family molybdenum-iron cluster-binding protein [Prolixibacteraceae bacterium]
MKKVAIPVSEGAINGHFGHSKEFQIFTLSEENQIINKEKFYNDQGCGCKSNLAGILKLKGVNTLLAGNLGNGAKQNLQNEGIEVFSGFSGTPEDALNKWISGNYFIHTETCSGGHNCSH